MTILNGSLTIDDEDAMCGLMVDDLKVNSLYYLMVLAYSVICFSYYLRQELKSFSPFKLGRNMYVCIVIFIIFPFYWTVSDDRTR